MVYNMHGLLTYEQDLFYMHDIPGMIGKNLDLRGLIRFGSIYSVPGGVCLTCTSTGYSVLRKFVSTARQQSDSPCSGKPYPRMVHRIGSGHTQPREAYPSVDAPDPGY